MSPAEDRLKSQKYIVVLAHADGWGAESADKVVKRIHEKYPDLGIYLLVSQATKNKEGEIATKIDDLKAARALKETNLLQYFARIDALYDTVPPPAEPEMLTFKQLARRYCNGEVHYTTRGGTKGGEEAAAFITALEEKHGHGPEVLLSVDTMAILPKDLLERYQCFSTHPGPLDTIKIEGMQATLRSLVEQVLYDEEGQPLPAHHFFGTGMAHLAGTLFLQQPELDKGPPIRKTLSYICPGVCAYQGRDMVYGALTDAMLDMLPVLLDRKARTTLVENAMKEKRESDMQPHRRVGELEAGKFATWQGTTTGFMYDDDFEILQNSIINPSYFKNAMRQYYPGSQKSFEADFNAVYGNTLQQLATQRDQRFDAQWAHAPEFGAELKQYRNR